jgi:hypothetical protein
VLQGIGGGLFPLAFGTAREALPLATVPSAVSAVRGHRRRASVATRGSSGVTARPGPQLGGGLAPATGRASEATTRPHTTDWPTWG